MSSYKKYRDIIKKDDSALEEPSGVDVKALLALQADEKKAFAAQDHPTEPHICPKKSEGREKAGAPARGLESKGTEPNVCERCRRRPASYRYEDATILAYGRPREGETFVSRALDAAASLLGSCWRPTVTFNECTYIEGAERVNDVSDDSDSL